MSLERARQELRNSGKIYLGDSEARDELVWAYVRDRHDQVVQRGNSRRPAILYAIVHLSKNDYRMTPCSDWDPFYEGFGIKFRETKASAIAQDPGVPELRGDFLNVCSTIKSKCTAKLREPESLPARGHTDPLRPQQNSWGGLWTGFRVQHRLFRVRNSHWEPDSDPQFRIENWPVSWPAEGEALDEILRSHVVVPLPAEDVDGNRIHPLQYEETLKGAIVRVGFVLNHYFPLNGMHRFTADIDNIRVLVPPVTDPVVVRLPAQAPAPPQQERVAQRGPDTGVVMAELEVHATSTKKSATAPPATLAPKGKRTVRQKLNAQLALLRRRIESWRVRIPCFRESQSQ